MSISLENGIQFSALKQGNRLCFTIGHKDRPCCPLLDLKDPCHVFFVRAGPDGTPIHEHWFYYTIVVYFSLFFLEVFANMTE